MSDSATSGAAMSRNADTWSDDASPTVVPMQGRRNAFASTHEQGARPDIAPVAVPTEERVARLADAVRDDTPAAGLAEVAAMRRAGIPDQDIVDHFIPAAARLLGEGWESDAVSFAAVTIGTARLQSMLRDLAADLPHTSGVDRPEVALVVRETEYHTLGAVVTANQLRRKGVAVRLVLGRSDPEILRFMQERSFDAILISAAASERIESVRNLISKLRLSDPKAPPICIGGSILLLGPSIHQLTGADHVASDVDTALQLCDLAVPRSAPARPAGS